MLMFLIPYDAVMGLFGGSQGNQVVGEFNGSSVTQQKLSRMMQAYSFNNSGFYQGNDAGAENKAWNDLAVQTVYGEDLEEAGYQVGPDELENIMFGDNISSWVKSVYYQRQEPTQEIKDNMEARFTSQYSIQNRKQQSKMVAFEYNNQKLEKLIKGGFYANTLDAERDFLAKEDKVKIDYVSVDYANVPDSLVNVTDGDIRAFYSRNKNDIKYKQNPFREVSLVKYEILPSASDTADIVRALEDDLAEFSKADSDSTWLTNQGYGYAETAYTPGALAGKFDSVLVKGSIGSVVGPYIENGEYKVSKVLRKDRVITEAKGRHIFLSASFKEQDSVRVIADSLKQLLDDGANFSALASKWSADDTTSNSGGNLGWTSLEEINKPGNSVAQVKKLLAKGTKGSTYVADVGGGFSVYQPTEFKYDGVESILANMSRQIVPSEETRKNEFKNVSEFYVEFTDGESLLAAVSDQGKAAEVKKIFRTSKNIPGVSNSEKIVNWANNESTDKNEISDEIYDDANGSFYLAVLTEMQDDKIPSFSVVKDQMREGALKEAKYKYIASLMNSAELKNASLDDIKSAIDGAVKKTVTVKANSSNIQGISPNETEIVGSVFGTPEGKISNTPLKGDKAVVLYEVKEITVANLKTSYADEQAAIQKKWEGYVNRVKSTAQNTLVQDYRYKY